jgi:hypothetical protein
MAVYYLDADDEITSAAARIRGSADQRIALVLSTGSRVATSRINFKVLEREAKQRGKVLAIVAPDASARSLAQSAGLPVFSNVREYEAAEAARPRGIGPDVTGDVSDALGELAATIPATTGPRSRGDARSIRGGAVRGGAVRGGAVNGAPGAPVAPGAPATGAAGPGVAGSRPQPRRRHLGVSAVLLICLLVVMVAGGAFGAYLFWPSATVVLTLNEKPVGPLALTIKIDPAVSAVNDSTLTVPGITKSFDVRQSGTFNATGQNVVETAASGTVTFSSINTINSVRVPGATVLSTPGGISFATTASVTVPRATVSGTNITRGVVDTPVLAIKKGTAGNVGAHSIVRVPSSFTANGVSVTNAGRTTGGTHKVTPFVQQADIDKATASLTTSLGSSFAAMLSNPGTLPAGVQLFAGTGKLGPIALDPDPATLLNQQVASFELAAAATGAATQADTGNLRSLAERRIASGIQAGYSMVQGSIATTIGTPTAQGALVSVPISATASEAATVDVTALKASIKGKSVEEARAYLSQFGTVTISLSPWWASSVSNYDFRIDLSVVAPAPHSTASPAAGKTPGASVSAGPSTSGGPSGSANAGPSASGSPAVTPTPGPSSSGGPSPSAS